MELLGSLREELKQLYPAPRRPQGAVRAHGLLGLHGHGARGRRRAASRPGSQRCIDEGPGYASPERAPGDARGRAGPSASCASSRWRSRTSRYGERAMNGLLLIGISHKTAPVELRERVALPEGRAVERAARAGLDGRDPRGGRALDLQPHRALHGGRRRRGGRDAPRSGSSLARPTSGPPSSSRTCTRSATATPRATCSGSPRGSTR